ncbi:unnamed protein product [Rotaria magnacalcarata]|uniref:Tc1-like transposase DDE domain-containing protein n=2 Tax=Rotaria magnacalcarata TaxID=392030 RepID=A0A8S3FPY8_9BILA|nr:unnamed protein product [Rotaria magnacalcarata]CAF5137626.1 unnamed protein product [Rotaria magnacalcarata]
MGKKAVSIDTNKGIILLRDTATKPGAGRLFKMTRHQKRAIKLQQLRDDTLSLNVFVRYAQASLNLDISRQTVSLILREFDLVSFRNDLKRHERFQPRVHRGGGLGIWSYITYNDLGPLVFFNGRLYSDKYIEILENNLPNVFEKFSSEQSKKFLYQQDNARPHTSAKTSKYFKKKHIKLIPWPTRSPDLNIIENIWSIVDQKLLKYSISNMAQLEEALKTVWAEISKDVTRKIFQSMPTRLLQVINNTGYACCY